MLKVLVWLIASVLGAILYRMGGSEKFDTLFRDLGVSLITLLLLGFLGLRFSWFYVLVFGLQWGALSTYRYFLHKPVDYYWYYYSLHGFMIGLACFPLYWVGFHWYSILGRTLLMAITMGIWSHFQEDAIKEELGRGFIVTSTIPLLLI